MTETTEKRARDLSDVHLDALFLEGLIDAAVHLEFTIPPGASARERGMLSAVLRAAADRAQAHSSELEGMLK